jgi:hypothetical protein
MMQLFCALPFIEVLEREIEIEKKNRNFNSRPIQM